MADDSVESLRGLMHLPSLEEIFNATCRAGRHGVPRARNRGPHLEKDDARHSSGCSSYFEARFFENDMLSPDGGFEANIYQVLGILATPGAFVSYFTMPTLLELALRPPGPRSIGQSASTGSFSQPIRSR